MYPLYWTTSKGGIFMRYSYEFRVIGQNVLFLMPMGLDVS